MTLLYQCDSELILEMAADALRVVEKLIREALLSELFPDSRKGIGPTVFNELDSFANAIRSELQHREVAVAPVMSGPDEWHAPPGPYKNNADLV